MDKALLNNTGFLDKTGILDHGRSCRLPLKRGRTCSFFLFLCLPDDRLLSCSCEHVTVPSVPSVLSFLPFPPFLIGLADDRLPGYRQSVPVPPAGR